MAVQKLTFEDITVGTNESSKSVRLVVVPPSFIDRATRPNLAASSLADLLTVEPLSVIYYLVFNINWRTVHDVVITLIGFSTVVKISDLLSDFHYL